MSRELLSDTDIESLTAEFGAKVGFNSVELQGFRGMVRKAVNAADVTRHKVKRIFTSKHDPTRNNGLDNAKDRRDNEYLYKHDKRMLRHEERKDRMDARNERRDEDQHRAKKYRDIQNTRFDRNNERKTKRDEERENYAHHENNLSHTHQTMHNHNGSGSERTRSQNSNAGNTTQYHEKIPAHNQNDNVLYPNTNDKDSQQYDYPTATAPHIVQASKDRREPAHNPQSSDARGVEQHHDEDNPYGSDPTEACQRVQGNVYIV